MQSTFFNTETFCGAGILTPTLQTLDKQAESRTYVILVNLCQNI